MFFPQWMCNFCTTSLFNFLFYYYFSIKNIIFMIQEWVSPSLPFAPALPPWSACSASSQDAWQHGMFQMTTLHSCFSYFTKELFDFFSAIKVEVPQLHPTFQPSGSLRETQRNSVLWEEWKHQFSLNWFTWGRGFASLSTVLLPGNKKQDERKWPQVALGDV